MTDTKKCSRCKGYGTLGRLKSGTQLVCRVCKGTGLKQEVGEVAKRPMTREEWAQFVLERLEGRIW